MPPSTNPQEGSPTPDEGPPANGQSRWLSQGWESLVHRLVTQQQPVDAAGCHCDVLIIGSGYGGAMAAAELGGALDAEGHAARIWLLERGLATAGELDRLDARAEQDIQDALAFAEASPDPELSSALEDVYA